MVGAVDKSQVEALFFEARGRSEPELSAFLDQACRDDQPLRLAVEQLLDADTSEYYFLDRPLDLAATAGHDRAESVGAQIGPFKLQQEIGEGGFGVVYMAEQTVPVRRKVAVKIIKPGMDSREVTARFEAERQALAMMDHPNIAKVLDAGTTDAGRPYFAMELVRGITITDYCDQNRLNARDRLHLFKQVCQAVQHAHQKGIIHRDIKPSNVMVTLHDGKPVPKLIDFGVAKALSTNLTDKTLFTRYGQIIGTPQCMSPEQAEMSGLDIDTRSDIYSLGILLYELLTGQTPIDAESLRGGGYDAMRQMIQTVDPPKPSTRLCTLDNVTATSIASHRATVPHALSKLVTGDLDWIVMKALDKDRNRRYESTNGLLGDIDRYLHDEPVAAGPPSFGYQVSKLYRRHKAAMASLTTIGAVLLAGIGLATWAWAREREQHKIAIVAQQDAEESRALAVANGEDAQAQAEVATREASRAKATIEVLRSLLAQSTPDPQSGSEVKVSDFLRVFALRLDTERLEDPNVELEVRLTLASTELLSGRFLPWKLHLIRLSSFWGPSHLSFHVQATESTVESTDTAVGFMTRLQMEF